MKNKFIDKIGTKRLIIAGLGLVIFFSILFVTFRLLKKETFYAIEVKSKSAMVLHFDEDDILISVECLNDDCRKVVDAKKIEHLHYDNLQVKLKELLKDEIPKNGIKIRVIKGQKNIGELKSAFIQKDDVNEEITEESKNDVETNKEENQANDHKNNSHTGESSKLEKEEINVKEETPVTDKIEVTPLNITGMWIWGYSFHHIKFDHYNTSPMGYKKYVDSVPFGWANGETVGHAQIFNLNNVSGAKNEACLTFTYNDEHRNSPGASTIVPIYNNGEITYKRYCFGIDEIEYNKTYEMVMGDTLSDYVNVYEWKNNKWVYIGIFDDILIELPTPSGYTSKYYITSLAENAYEWVKQEQRDKWNAERDAKLAEIERQKDELRKNIYTDPDWSSKDTALQKEWDRIADLYTEFTYYDWYDFSKLTEK